MKNKGYLGLLAIPLAALGVVGSVAFAQTNVPQSAPAPVQTVQQATADKEVADQNEVKDQSDSQSEQAEQASLQAKATISADQAKKAAEAKVGGTATAATLEDENGTVVYAVTVGTQEVKVNATNGSIVKVESDGADQGADASDTANGDTETNDGPNTGN